MNIKGCFVGSNRADFINIFTEQETIIPPSINAILPAMPNPKKTIKVKQQELAGQL